jgi:hypothetical protein
MKVDMTPVEFDMKQLFSAFIDCYEVLDFLANKEQSDNERDLDDIDPMARENLTFIPCRVAEDVLRHALV